MKTQVLELSNLVADYVLNNYSHKYVIVIYMNTNRHIQDKLIDLGNIIKLNSINTILFAEEGEAVRFWNKIKVEKVKMEFWSKGTFRDKN